MSRRLNDDEQQLARRLTALLRHGKPRQIVTRSDGFVALAEVRKVHMFGTLDLELARAIVLQDNKQRFSLTEEAGVTLIRANQGHTIKGLDDALLLTRVSDPKMIPVVVHGTYHSAWPLILESGLSRMERNHVHFASGLPSDFGVVSGMRRSAEVLIYVDAAKAMAAGISFFISSNGVILSPGPILAQFFSKVVDARSGEHISFRAPSALQPPSATTESQSLTGRFQCPIWSQVPAAGIGFFDIFSGPPEINGVASSVEINPRRCLTFGRIASLVDVLVDDHRTISRSAKLETSSTLRVI